MCIKCFPESKSRFRIWKEKYMWCDHLSADESRKRHKRCGGLNFELATRAPYRHIVILPLKMLLVLFVSNWYNQLRRLKLYHVLMLSMESFHLLNDWTNSICLWSCGVFPQFYNYLCFASLSLDFAFQSYRWYSNYWLKAPLAFIRWKWDVNSNTWMNVNREPEKQKTKQMHANTKSKCQMNCISVSFAYSRIVCWSILFGVL